MIDLWHWLPVIMHTDAAEAFEDRLRQRWDSTKLIIERQDWVVIRSDDEAGLLALALAIRGEDVEKSSLIGEDFIGFDASPKVASTIDRLLDQLSLQGEREPFAVIHAGFLNESDYDLLKAETTK